MIPFNLVIYIYVEKVSHYGKKDLSVAHHYLSGNRAYIVWFYSESEKKIELANNAFINSAG